MKVTVLLRNDHEEIKSLLAQYLFAKFKKGGSRIQDKRRELFDVIQRQLITHSQMEKEVFYPALTSSRSAGQLLPSALEKHRTMEKLLREMAGMNLQDRNFEARLNQLINEVNSHIAGEEEEIFDEARKSLPEYRLEELGLEIEHRRRSISGRPALWRLAS